ncbi:MAG: RNB domain-containing ribonuclease, partial [Candidatus Latescibacteria bacterium]|nr:RNB domain-containing ribonuclease [Candidatus Latescibacterota bacterium]
MLQDRSPDIGEIILFRQRKQVKMGVVQALRDGKIEGEDSNRKSFKISSDRIVYATGIQAEAGRAALNAFHKSAVELAQRIALEEVWEVAKDDTALLTSQDIAELVWEEISPLRCAALLFHLHDECPYFRPVGENWAASPEEEVRLHLERLRQRGLQEQEEARFSEWLTTDQAPDALTDKQKRWFEEIREVALLGEEARISRPIKNILHQGGTEPSQRAFDIFVRKGIWDEDEHLELLRDRIPVAFSESAWKEAEQLRTEDALSAKDCADLTGLHLFSIDDESTTDIDDACSVERTPSGWRVGVHITDVASLIPIDSALGAAAQERLTSLYLPDQKIPMFPPPFSEQIGSLLPGAPRLALSVLFDLDEDLEVRDTHILSSRIVNRERLSYEQVDAILDGEAYPLSESLRLLDRFSEKLQCKRIAAGAVMLERTEIQIHVDQDKRITLRKRFRETRSNRIVSEMMILVNRYVAALCAEHELPVGYRTQDPVALDDLEDISNEALRRHQILRRVKFSKLSTEPGPHHLLGVDCYTQVTSPLRRFPDLLVQRQIVRYLTQGDVVYDRDEMASLLQRVEEQIRALKRLERRRERYWLLKYLQPSIGEEFSAVVLEVRGKNVRAELTECA